jgi:hypothetical protein
MQGKTPGLEDLAKKKQAIKDMMRTRGPEGQGSEINESRKIEVQMTLKPEDGAMRGRKDQRKKIEDKV